MSILQTIFFLNLTTPSNLDLPKEVQETNIEEPTIPPPSPDHPPAITQDLPPCSSSEKTLPQGKGSASEEELKAFSPEFDNLLLDISEPSYIRRAFVLIAQQEDRDVF